MTRYSSTDLFILDPDWFACDCGDEIGHFAAGGKECLPERVVQSVEEAEIALAYFNSLARVAGSMVLSGHMKVWCHDWDEFEYKREFLDEIADWAERGLYSFYLRLDHLEEKYPFYGLVGTPLRPLALRDVPPQVSAYLSEVRLPFRFRELHSTGLRVERAGSELVSLAGLIGSL